MLLYKVLSAVQQSAAEYGAAIKMQSVKIRPQSYKSSVGLSIAPLRLPDVVTLASILYFHENDDFTILIAFLVLYRCHDYY